MIEATYTKENIKEEEIDEIDEKTWSIFIQCDEIGAKSYLKNNVYVIEAYYEDKFLYNVCTQKLENLGFKLGDYNEEN